MRAICTYCSAEKSLAREPLPAVQRYLSPRIARLNGDAAARELTFSILSGEYGLLAPEALLPWYDHLLLPEEVEALVPKVAAALTDAGITTLEYHTADPALVPAVRPYHEVARQACAQAGTTFEVVLLAGNPG